MVLGDDIVIFNDDIAREYLLLCKGLGVTINTTKSVVANRPVVEFAKRTSFYGFDVSPLSFKEFISNNNFFGRLAVATKIVNRSWGKYPPLMFRLACAESNTKVRMSYPIVGYLASLVRSRQLTMEHLISLIVKADKPLSYFGSKLDSFDNPRAQEMFNNILLGKKILTVSMENLWFASSQKQAYKMAMFEEAKRIYNKISLKDFGVDSSLEFTKLIGGVGAQIYFEHFWKPNLMETMLLGNSFRWANFPDFYTSETWTLMTLDEVADLLLRVRALKQAFTFYNIPAQRRKEIDNPIKILEFIRNARDRKITKLVAENPVMSFPTNIFPMFLLKK